MLCKRKACVYIQSHSHAYTCAYKFISVIFYYVFYLSNVVVPESSGCLSNSAERKREERQGKTSLRERIYKSDDSGEATVFFYTRVEKKKKKNSLENYIEFILCRLTLLSNNIIVSVT